jgi:hypothetical protein
MGISAAPSADTSGTQSDDRGGALAKYERAWQEIDDALVRARDIRATLKQLVDRYDAGSGAYDGLVPKYVAGQIERIDLGTFAGQPEPNRLAVLHGRYVALPKAPSCAPIFRLIAQCVDPEVDCIVEFGSGIGVNLARLRLMLPDANVTYLACEPTASGRSATRRLFQADPKARLDVRHFDYHAACDLDLRGFRKIVALTCHSIEQVTVLGEDFYEMLLGTNIACCIHVEPVGWQRFTNVAAFVRSAQADGETRRSCFSGYTFQVEDSRLVDNAAVWSALCRYNTDILSVVAGAAERGRINIFALAYDCIGSNPFNPSTVLAWRRAA